MRKEYKGFLVCLDKYYIELNNIDQTKEYEFKLPHLVEIKENNRKSYLMNEYMGNKKIYDAIDLYSAYKDRELLRPAHSLVFDQWFDVLKYDTNSFHKTFGLGRIDIRFMDLDSCMVYWKEFGSKHEGMNEFLTDDKIKEFWDIQLTNDLIGNCRRKNFDSLIRID